MKKLSFAAGASAIALAVAGILPATGVYANTATYDGTNNLVPLTRTVSGVSNPVTNTFTYTITNTSAPDSGTSTMPTSETIVFNNTAVSGGSASLTKNINLSSVDFSKVGDYVYTISETGSTDTTNYPIDTASNSYELTVQVRYDVDANNVPNMNTWVAAAYIKKGANKVSAATWTSAAARTSLTVNADTTGNMADTTKCFDYTITIPAGNGVVAGDTYSVNYLPASTPGCTNPSTITAGTAATISLRHGDALTIGGTTTHELPVGASYTITKTDTTDGYTTKMDGTTATTTGAKTAGSNAANNVTDIENTKNSDPVTGIVTSAWFYILLLSIGAFGIFFIIARRRKDDEEEQ